MNTLIKVLNEKLKMLGYNESIIAETISKIDISLIENKLNDVEDYSNYVEVYEYDEPCIEIIRAFLNINNEYIQCEVLEGEIKKFSAESVFRTRFIAANYRLDKKCSIITVSNDFKIKIYVYTPTQRNQILYEDKTYEDVYKAQRDEVTLEYKVAIENRYRTLSINKIEEILNLLVMDYIMDEIALYNLNPTIGLFTDPYKYAEKITTYSLRFINNKTNRIEIYESEPNLRRMDSKVVPGICTNDPYIRLDERPAQTDFLLNTISYYWVKGEDKKPDKIAIFNPEKPSDFNTFIELQKNSIDVKMVIDDVLKIYRRSVHSEVDYEEYIKEVIKSLNLELVATSLNTLRDELKDIIDSASPILYRYRFISEPKEFEENLYVSIEDNIGKEYRYKISEAVMEDLTRIGNKLEYTDENGELVRRQSIADFNVNAPTAIIRKETFTDADRIPDLLGYIYEDLDSYGTEKLPIPILYVDIYIPQNPKTEISMYNGTSLNFTLDDFNNNKFFYNTGNNASYIEGGPQLPGSTYVTVKYVNSKDEILKENRIGNLFPNSTYMPEILPIINDTQGREWRAELTRIEPLIIKSNPEENIIKLKYNERFTRVHFSFINREGKKIAEDKQEIIQVGENYNFDSKKTLLAKDNDEWSLKFSRPSKFVAKDDEEKNKVILVYDIERTDILIKYLRKDSDEEIAESKAITVAANKKYNIDVPKFIRDLNGLGWNYIEGTDTNILAQRDILNEVKLYYTEAKVPVTIRFKNEKNIKLIDDKVELIQIGKKYSYKFDEQLIDFQCREWLLKNESKNIEIIVDKEKEKNIIEGIFEPFLANITIKFLNTENRAIKSDELEKAQIGEFFNSERLEEIIDNFGKAWKCISSGDKIIVNSKEVENVISLKYEPLMAKVTVKYIDAENNELMEPKYETLQVGSAYKNKPIERFTSKDGKKWKIDYDKIPSIVVKKYEEENIYSIYYDKEKAKVTLTFFDAYNNELMDSKEIESQIGAEVETELYERITAKNGERWQLETSEPKKMIVRETNNSVKLIYGEVKSKVLVKHIDIRTQQTIIENLVTTVKLGGIYIPNIQMQVLDKNKYRWKYIGDENISIVTKENEQENIIVLTYEQDRAKVILKYNNTKHEKIREDAIKDVQIGKEIRIEPIQKFNDSDGLLWKYSSIKMDNKIVEEKDNIIYATYEPVIASIKIRYVDSKGNSIIEDKIVKMQVGKEFIPEIIDRVTGLDNKVWVYNKISAEKIIVKEDSNEIIMTFEKLMQDITVQFVDEEGILIADPNIYSKQVGEIFKIPYENAYQDVEEKAWLLVKTDAENIATSEFADKNIVKVWYKKELVDVQLKYLNDTKDIIRENTTEKVQIGSIYIPKPFKEIIDEKTKLGWKLPDNYDVKYKVKRNPEENILVTEYEKLKVNVYVRYKDGKDMEIIEQTIYKEQVGTTFTPIVDQEIKDKEDKEWLFGLEESKFLGGVKNKIESIVVARDENKNFIDLRYRPWLIKVTIKYQEPLGNLIRQDTEVDAQIGSIYEAEIIEIIQDKQKVKWIYNPNSKISLKVTHEEKDNIIVLGYEEEKALVTYKYHDEYGNRLRTPKRKLVQIGSLYEPEIENIVEDFQGRVWEYKAKSIDRLEIKEDESTNIIEVIYKPLKVDTILRFVNGSGKQILKDQIIKAQLGSEFTPDIQEKITDENSKLFKYIKCVPESLKIKEIPIGALESPNIFELTYEGVFSEVRVTYKTIDGKTIKEDEVSEVQVGTIFDPVLAQYVTDDEGIQWELISKDIDSIRIKEDTRENIISMIYEVAKAEVTVRYKDMDGNAIKKSDIIPMEVGREFIPNIEKELIDENNKKWVFSVAEPVKLTVGSINNIINVTYQEKKVQVVVKYRAKDGKQLKEDYRIKIQVGTRFEPQNTTKVIYNENEIWRFVSNEPSSIVISENISENVITQLYTKEERPEEKKVENVPYYNPEIEKFIDKDLVKEMEEKEQEQNKIIEEIQEEKVEFEIEKLKLLEKNISLKANEKKAIIKLNELNDRLIRKLNDAIMQGANVDYQKLEDEINEVIQEEKKTIQEDLKTLIEDDRTGKHLLKIFEAVTSSEITDKNFNVLQQRKTILIPDYYINQQITEMEQAKYICDKGIVEKAIECIDEKYNAPLNKKEKNRDMLNAEYLRIKIVLMYERALIINYNKARSNVKDEYFIKDENKTLVPPEVVVIVSNSLPNQAYKLITKLLDLSIMKQNELDAILKLLNTQQLGTLMIMIEKIPDGKIRKLAIKKLKEIM